MNKLVNAILILAFLLMPSISKAGALQDEILKIGPSYVGIHETWGPNRGPRVNEIIQRAGSTPGQPWCMALVYTINDDAARNIGIKNPLPRTASSATYWIYANKHKLTFKVIPANQVLLGIKIKPASTGIFKHGAYRRNGTFSGHADVVMRQLSKKQYRGIDGNTSETDKALSQQWEGGCSAWKTRTLGIPSFLVMGFIEVR